MIRTMTEADRREVSELYAAAWKAGYKGLLPQLFLDSLTARGLYERQIPNGFLAAGSFVLEVDGEIAAHCHARPANETNMKGWGEIHTIYVRPDHWRRGLGARLITHAVNWLKEQGFNNVYLYVLEGNQRAQNFYRAQGFIPTEDRLLCEIGGETVTDIRMIMTAPRSGVVGKKEMYL